MICLSSNVKIREIRILYRCYNFFLLTTGSRYYYAGPRIPRNNDTITTALLNSKGTNVIPNYDFYHEGKITQWEFEGIKTGDVKLQVR